MNHLVIGIYKSSKRTHRVKRKITKGQIWTLPNSRLFGACNPARSPPGLGKGKGMGERRGDAGDALHRGRGRL